MTVFQTVLYIYMFRTYSRETQETPMTFPKATVTPSVSPPIDFEAPVPCLPWYPEPVLTGKVGHSQTQV